MNDLIDFIKKFKRKRNRGPQKVACTYKGPAVKPPVISTYYIKRTIPLVIILGSEYKQTGPAVTKVGDHTNDNDPQ